MNKCFLKDIAQIDISSVDKKVKENEISIKLCNFTDVYNNWAITERMYNNFMNATANRSEIERYKLKKGMIAITKDSEKKEDIGMSSYIADSFDDVILGYHTALINPYIKNVDSKYLNAYLNSYIARKYFSKSASGSGQRYTLTIDIIKKLPLYLPSLDIQKKIGNLLSNIDRKIEINYQINNNLEELMKTIYQRWFIEFEFPNEEGKPYKSNGGKLYYNDKLKRKIPENWGVNELIEVADIYQPKTIPIDELKEDGKYNVYGANGIIGKYDLYNHEENEIAVCCRGAGCGKYIMTQPFSWITGNAMVIKPKLEVDLKEYIYYKLDDKDILNYVTGSAQPQITRTNIENMKIMIPDKAIINKFNSLAKETRKNIINLIKENQRLDSLKEFILPLLMNGQINVDDIEI